MGPALPPDRARRIIQRDEVRDFGEIHLGPT
jgi:hypothetical protein